MLIVVLSAAFCVLTRVYLIIFDRHVFRKADSRFSKPLFLNSFLPFFVAMTLTSFSGYKENFFWEYLFLPGVIVSALSAQLTAYVFASCFVKMPVKNIVIATKSVDLFIPLLFTVLTKQFKAFEYFFSWGSALIFTPLLFPLKKTISVFDFKWMLLMILALLFQAGVNSYFSIYELAETAPHFLALMCCLLFWRSAISLYLPIAQFLNKTEESNWESKHQMNYALLFVRAIISMVSQAAFYYSITRVSGNLAWPILNVTPLAACFSAHLVLKEKTGKPEIIALAGLSIFILIYSTTVIE